MVALVVVGFVAFVVTCFVDVVFAPPAGLVVFVVVVAFDTAAAVYEL